MKILLVDVETSPIIGATWELYDTNVIHILRDWHLLSFAYKWLDSPVITYRSLPDYPASFADRPHSDYHLVQELGLLLDQADVVVAHNGDKFDIRKINTRIITHGLPIPAPYKTVDTLKVARKYFAFSGNRLKHLAEHFGLGTKLEPEGVDKVRVWMRCIGEEGTDAEQHAAWEWMREYNPNDVLLLDGVYRRLVPWVPFPYASVDVCPKCGADSLQKRGVYRNKTTQYQRFYCASCGGWSRQRNNKPEYVGV